MCKDIYMITLVLFLFIAKFQGFWGFGVLGFWGLPALGGAKRRQAPIDDTDLYWHAHYGTEEPFCCRRCGNQRESGVSLNKLRERGQNQWVAVGQHYVDLWCYFTNHLFPIPKFEKTTRLGGAFFSIQPHSIQMGRYETTQIAFQKQEYRLLSALSTALCSGKRRRNDRLLPDRSAQ